MLTLAFCLQNHIIFTQALPNRRHMPRTTTSTQFINSILQQLAPIRKWRQYKKTSKNFDQEKRIEVQRNVSNIAKKSSSFRVCKVGRSSAIKAAAATVSDAHLERAARHGATLRSFWNTVVVLGLWPKIDMHSKYPFFAPCPRFRSSLLEQCEYSREK